MKNVDRPVSDGDGRAARCSFVKSVLDHAFRLCVKCAGSLIEEQDLRVGDDGAGNGDTLLLTYILTSALGQSHSRKARTSGQQEASFADHGFVAVGKQLNKRVRVRLDASLANHRVLALLRLRFPRRTDQTMSDITPDRRGEQDRLLRHQPNLATQPLDIEFANVDTIERNTAGLDIVEPLDELDDCRFAAAAGTYESRRFSGFESDAESLENGHFWAGGIGELDVFECDVALDGLRLLAAGVGGVDGRDTVDRGEQFSRCAACVRDGLKLRREERDGE